MATAEAVICGAGIAGISAAYHLSVDAGLRNVVIIDERPPLSLTSDKSTECYRNWWPGPGDAMVAFMNRSIDILEDLARESDNRFLLNRRGYLFATADESRVQFMHESARVSCELGAGQLRVHEGGTGSDEYMPAPLSGFEEQPGGADMITDQALIRRHFPYLNPDTMAVLHARRCGWLSAQQLGMYLLERARGHGARLVNGRLVDVDTSNGCVQGVTVVTDHGTQSIATDIFINAAGPFFKHVGHMLEIELPVFGERHVKLAFHDNRGAFPREAPLIIWIDSVELPWSEEERATLAGEPDGEALLETFPAGVHGRPAGGDSVLIYWTYDSAPAEPVFPITWDPAVPEIFLRGMSAMVPSLETYFGHLPKPYVDGGYYAKTEENRPLISSTPVEGAYLMGAFSGFGIMAACAAGELLAAYVTGSELPTYASAFTLDRYQDPVYQALLVKWDSSGQL